MVLSANKTVQVLPRCKFPDPLRTPTSKFVFRAALSNFSSDSFKKGVKMLRRSHCIKCGAALSNLKHHPFLTPV